MVRTAIRTTKAIIRESARLVNLTLGRAGFFYAPQAPTRRATSGTNRRSIGSAYHAKEKSRYGVVFPCGNLHPSKPLTSLFFGLFRLRFLKLHLPTFGTLRSRWLYDFLNALADTDTLFHLLCHLWKAVLFRPLSSILCQAINELVLCLA